MQTQRCLGSNRPQTGLLQSRSLNSRFQPTHRRRPLPPAMVFTGIVQGMAEVVNVDSKDNFSQLRIAFPPGHVDGIKLGASVAINGTCLTVTQAQGEVLNFDVMMETLRATSLGGLQTGSRVNFERAAKFGDEVGGHNVSGHVHSTARISNVEETPNNRRVTITLEDPKWMKYILPKGYIAVDGTSLTVGEVTSDSFTVYLIPETLRATVLGIKGVGDKVNIEVETQTQAIVDTVERVVAQYLNKA
uniref:Lumazine-binding domain-containing protein n=1 Tax=Dunaliella tertiolecta TaxID=3047 RepID=A0A7S3RAB6_DUNTE|mmetsp:Transcript_13183/g.35879  ORF Transcript_13183/g.35879 Transcript_13183/m.35879 type:complete len:246 (+) Transcript_13183:91-828(+)